MTETARKMKQQLASLPPQDQLALSEFLWDVITSMETREWDRAWAAESQRRWDSAERGETAYLSRDESMRQARERLERLP